MSESCEKCQQPDALCECACWVCGGVEGMFWDGEILACERCLPQRAPERCSYCKAGPEWGHVCAACSESWE
jgi:hypothetical protein